MWNCIYDCVYIVYSHMQLLYGLMKKALRETQTLRAGCSKVEPKKNHPAADPLPRGAGRPNFNQLEMVTTFTYRLSLVVFQNRCTQFRVMYVMVVTDPQTYTQTQTGPITIHCATKLSAQCNYAAQRTDGSMEPVRLSVYDINRSRYFY